MFMATFQTDTMTVRKVRKFKLKVVSVNMDN